MRTISRGILLLLSCTLLALPAVAQTVYKLIDKNGKVTYSETPPKNFDGKVIRMDVDPNANTAVLPKPNAPAVSTTAGEGASKSSEALRRSPAKDREEDKIERARARVEDAKQRLQDLKDNPADSDIVRMGKAGGGTRPAPTDDYLQRLERAEANVKAAEEELARLESGR